VIRSSKKIKRIFAANIIMWVQRTVIESRNVFVVGLARTERSIERRLGMSRSWDLKRALGDWRGRIAVLIWSPKSPMQFKDLARECLERIMLLLLVGVAGVMAAGLAVGGRNPQSKTRLVVARLANGARIESDSAQLRRKLPTGTPRRASERRSGTIAAKGGTQRRVGDGFKNTVVVGERGERCVAAAIAAAVDCSSSAGEIQICGIVNENMYS